MATHQQVFKRQNIEVHQSDRLVYVLNWYNRAGKRTQASTATRDHTEAKQVALGLEQLANDPTAYDADPLDRRFETVHPRAKMIFWSLKELPVRATPMMIVPTDLDDGQLRDYAPQELPRKVGVPRVGRFIAIPNKEAGDAEEKAIGFQRQIELLKKEKENWERERMELQHRLNDHTSATLQEAIAKFDLFYKADHDPHTYRQVLRTIREASDEIGLEERIGAVKGREINEYLSSLEVESSTTRRKYRAYVSTFWTWAVKTYELNGNPMDHVHSYSATAPEHIEAVRELDDLREYLKRLEDWPYWHAWVAFACLAGPRWGEQTRVKLADVISESSYVRLYAGKTKKERSVPIERTLLKPILQKYIKEVRPTILPTGEDGKPVEQPWLFPALVSGHGSKGDGRWRSSTWHMHYNGGVRPDDTQVVGVRDHARKKYGKKFYWAYGPDEWRHCAGTAMGHAGHSSLQISQWLGNSETIAKRHYIAPIGEPWPLKWTER